MIMFILEDFVSEVHNVRYINLIVLAEESAFVHSPVGCSGGWQVCCRDGVERSEEHTSELQSRP